MQRFCRINFGGYSKCKDFFFWVKVTNLAKVRKSVGIFLTQSLSSIFGFSSHLEYSGDRSSKMLKMEHLKSFHLSTVHDKHCPFCFCLDAFLFVFL